MALTDEAIERIKAMIVSGELRPGDRLPKEADLAERLGLSRNSLREAVKALSLVRVLDVRQGDGTYVTSLQPEILLDTVGFVIDFHRDDAVLHLLEVRRILEPAATALAALAMSDSDIAALGVLVDAACPAGTPGPFGPTGSVGPPDPGGPPDLAGVPGPLGHAGPAGSVGPTDPAMPPDPAGVPGPAGVPDPAGVPGPAGPPGLAAAAVGVRPAEPGGRVAPPVRLEPVLPATTTALAGHAGPDPVAPPAVAAMGRPGTQLGPVERPVKPAADMADLISADLEFHRRIAIGSGNPALAALIESLSAPALRARIWSGLTAADVAGRMHDQHRAIYQALRSRQPEVARAWSTAHVAGLEDWLRR